MREVHSFLGHVGSYKRFIQDFSKIALPLSKLCRKRWILSLTNHARRHSRS
uniref:Uncharacterized protein n=1 Tax=Cajanus cajan TaxID=3821 RepID=A0A151SKH1_CAJCA|nr:hypothetical protein KK1_001459 [Cajanus cajan]